MIEEGIAGGTFLALMPSQHLSSHADTSFQFDCYAVIGSKNMTQRVCQVAVHAQTKSLGFMQLETTTEPSKLTEAPTVCVKLSGIAGHETICLIVGSRQTPMKGDQYLRISRFRESRRLLFDDHRWVTRKPPTQQRRHRICQVRHDRGDRGDSGRGR
jgi:hypothetical protein